MLSPPDLSARPDQTQPASPADVLASLRGGWGDARQANASNLL